MSKKEVPLGRTGELGGPDSRYAVVLPCEPDYFREFIAGLLGKPQTITKVIVGNFEMNKDDIANFHHLIIQRVSQQNEATVIQFTVTITYNDKSTVLLNSFDDFMNYNEVRPVVSVSANLSWIFLVRFQGKNAPEKQQIDLSINTEMAIRRARRTEYEHFLIDDYGAHFYFRISHTARSWGADIEALLTGHIENLIKHIHPVKKYLIENSGLVGFIVGAIAFLSSIVASFYSTSALVDNRLSDIRELQTPIAKSEYIAELIASGVWPRFFFSILTFLVIAFVVSIILGALVGGSAGNREPSFLLLSKQSGKLKQQVLHGYKRKWKLFALSVVGAIIIELVGNYLFTVYLERWLTP